MEKHFFFISLRKTLFLTATFVLLIGNTQPSYAMLGVDEELQVMQNGIVKGRIVDTNGEAVIGANVKLKGSNQGTITDVDGNFSLENVSEDILIVSYIGFEEQEVAIKGRKYVKVILKENSQLLDEVVVVGYGAQKKVNLTGAVASLDVKQLESRPITSASQSLAGKIAGVHIAQSSGMAGADGAQITIRGLGTLNNTSPLILIDGVISPNMDVVNPADIESISVLKDAASASIYGSQAANGVVLVSTKKGKAEGKSTFNVSAGLSWSKMTDQSKPDMVTDPETFMLLMNEARINSGLESAFPDEVIERYRTPKFRDACSTDWFDQIFRTATTQEYNMSASGGNNKTKYYFSLGYMDQGSIASSGNYKRITARLNLDTYVLPKLKIGASIGYTYGDQRTPNGSVDEVFALDLMRANPLNPAYNSDGTIAMPDNTTLSYTGQVQGENPLTKMLYNEIHQKNNNIYGNAFLSWDIFPELKVYAYLNANVQLRDYSEWKGCPEVKNWRYEELLAEGADMEDVISDGYYGNGSLKMSSARDYRINPYVQMEYSKSIGRHHMRAMVAASYEATNYDYFDTSRGKYISNYVHILDSGDPSTVQNSSSMTQYAILSQFGRVNYDFADKYLFEFNLRRDGSSRFGSNFKYGIFPSFSVGWVLTQENFMKKIPTINFLKLRASWGQLGNQYSSDNFPYIAKIGYDGNYVWGNEVATGVVPTSYGNPDIHWETTNVTNVGFNLHLFNSELVLEGDYFMRKTKDILFDTPLPYETGFKSVLTNLAEVQNSGFELSATYQKRLKDFHFSIGGNMSHIQNKVNAIDPGMTGETDRHISGNKITTRNKPMNSYYMLKWTGKIYQTQEEVDAFYEMFYWNADHTGPKAGNILPAPSETNLERLRPGARRYVDLDGDGAITNKDIYYAGETSPRLTFGFKAGLEWKGIDVSAFFQGVGKQVILRGGSVYAPFVVNYVRQNYTFMGKTWAPDHTNAEYPILSRNQNFNKFNYNNIDASVQKNRYIRLKSLVVGYSLPKQWIAKAGLNKLRVYFSGDDLWEWTKIKDGYDPENGEGGNTTFPFSRLLTFGIDVTF